jgi:hypothetical protein
MSDLVGKNVDIMLPNSFGGLRRGRVIAKHCDNDDLLIIDLLAMGQFKSTVIIRPEHDLSPVITRYAAWGVCGGKIVVGDTKDNEPYARNSFAKHFGQEPEGVITQED